MKTLVLLDLDALSTDAVVAVLAMFRQRPRVDIGVVAHEDRGTAEARVGRRVLDEAADLCLLESGSVVYTRGVCTRADRLEEHLDHNDMNDLVALVLRLLGEMELPCRTSRFLTRHTSMLTVTPIGEAATPAKRQVFAAWDAEHGCMDRLAGAIRDVYAPHVRVSVRPDHQSLDILPGRARCLDECSAYDAIHYLTSQADTSDLARELASHPAVRTHRVWDTAHTERLLRTLWRLLV